MDPFVWILVVSLSLNVPVDRRSLHIRSGIVGWRLLWHLLLNYLLRQRLILRLVKLIHLVLHLGG